VGRHFATRSPWRRRPENTFPRQLQTSSVFQIIVGNRVIVGSLVTSLQTCESVYFFLNYPVLTNLSGLPQNNSLQSQLKLLFPQIRYSGQFIFTFQLSNNRSYNCPFYLFILFYWVVRLVTSRAKISGTNMSNPRVNAVTVVWPGSVGNKWYSFFFSWNLQCHNFLLPAGTRLHSFVAGGRQTAGVCKLRWTTASKSPLLLQPKRSQIVIEGLKQNADLDPCVPRLDFSHAYVQTRKYNLILFSSGKLRSQEKSFGASNC
jgi:hypothetical protein